MVKEGPFESKVRLLDAFLKDPCGGGTEDGTSDSEQLGLTCLCRCFLAVLLGVNHELRGPASGDGEGTVQGHQPGHALRLHRRDRGPAARRDLPVLAIPRALREAGRTPLPGESGGFGYEDLPTVS